MKPRSPGLLFGFTFILGVHIQYEITGEAWKFIQRWTDELRLRTVCWWGHFTDVVDQCSWTSQGDHLVEFKENFLLVSITWNIKEFGWVYSFINIGFKRRIMLWSAILTMYELINPEWNLLTKMSPCWEQSHLQFLNNPCYDKPTTTNLTWTIPVSIVTMVWCWRHSLYSVNMGRRGLVLPRVLVTFNSWPTICSSSLRLFNIPSNKKMDHFLNRLDHPRS